MNLGLVLAALVGLILGALVNWLSDRLPAMRSRLPYEEAETPVAGVESNRPAARYLAVEVVLAAAAVYLWLRFGPSASFGILLFYLTVFTLISVIDIEHRLILNVVMFPAFAVALLEVMLSGRENPGDALIGYALAQLVVIAFYLFGEVYLWIVNTRRDEPVTEVAFGFGDVTLATFCGLVVGYPRVLFMLVLMIVFGGLFAVLYLLYRAVVAREYRAHTPLPYGPSIILGATVMLLWGREIARLLGAQ